MKIQDYRNNTDLTTIIEYTKVHYNINWTKYDASAIERTHIHKYWNQSRFECGDRSHSSILTCSNALPKSESLSPVLTKSKWLGTYSIRGTKFKLRADHLTQDEQFERFASNWVVIRDPLFTVLILHCQSTV
jgi:hypothetical protein